jgi:hypothetical protein
MHKKKGMTIIIAVGGGEKPPPTGSNAKPSKKSQKEGCEMINLPIEALVDENGEGEEVSPEVGDAVVLNDVAGEVTGVEGGVATIDLQSVGGVPVEYAAHEAAEEEVSMEDEEGDALLEAAVAADKEEGY